MLPACPPTASTQPAITSVTAPGSRSVRCNSPRHAAAPRSTGWTPARDPLRLPTAVRTASMTYAGWADVTSPSCRDATEDDGEVLVADLLGRERSAGPIPADGHPGGVADEAVDEVDVEVGPEAALRDALLQDVHPHLPLLAVACVDETELRQCRQPLGLVLVDDDLGVPVLDGLERRHEQALPPFEGIGFPVDYVLIPAEQPVEEVLQDLFDHLLLGPEVVVQAARQDAR